MKFVSTAILDTWFTTINSIQCRQNSVNDQEHKDEQVTLCLKNVGEKILMNNLITKKFDLNCDGKCISRISITT